MSDDIQDALKIIREHDYPTRINIDGRDYVSIEEYDVQRQRTSTMEYEMTLLEVDNGRLERHNELLTRNNITLLETIADDNKHLAEKDRVIVLLRAVAEAYIALDEFEPGGEWPFYKVSMDATEAKKAAIDGGALSEDGDK